MEEQLKKEAVEFAQKLISQSENFNLSQLKKELGILYEKITILSFVEKYYDSLGTSESRKNYTVNKVAHFIEEQQREASIFDILVEACVVEPIKIGQPIEQKNVTPSYSEPKPVYTQPADNQPVNTQPTPPQPAPYQQVTAPAPSSNSYTTGQTQNYSAYEVYQQSKQASAQPTAAPASQPTVNQQYTPEPHHHEDSHINRYTQPLQSVAQEPEWVKAPAPESKPIDAYISQTQQLVFDRKEEPEPKPAPSINDHFGKTAQIGLNDRLAFIRQLFFGSESEYNKVMEHINHLHSVQDIALYIEQDVKPIYNHWRGKDEYEERFLSLILKRFEI